MEAEFVLGRVCIGMQHESGYARFVGLQLLLDTLLGWRISALDGEGDLFLGEVFFFGSSLLNRFFFLEIGLCFLLVDCYMVHGPPFASFT
jgi:hypothetical protein